MTENNVETIVIEEEVTITPVAKFKNALKNVDPKVYAVAAIAVIGALGFAAYKRIENFDEREATRTETIVTTVEV